MRVVRVSLVLVVVLVAMMPASLAGAQTPITPFIQLLNPVGVAVGGDGSVYISSDAVTTTTVTQFAADASQVNQTTLGGITVGNLGHMAVDATSGQLIYLTATGQVHVIHATTLEMLPLFDIPNMQIDTSAIFDITTGTIQADLSGIIVPQLANYGDIAVLRRDADTLDFFLSGSMKGYPFILRIRLLSDGTSTAKVLVSTLTPNVPEVTNPRGVAVNANGTVVTTLPAYPNGEFLVSFHADFAETGTETPLMQIVGITSQGMDSDAAGNFYVATGLDDIPLCGMSGGAVVLFSADLVQYSCTPSGLGLGLTRDLAVIPDGSGFYLPAASGTVWWYGLNP